MTVVGFGFLCQPRKSEIGDFGVEFVVEKNVAGLHVSMVNGWNCRGVKISKAFGGLMGDA